MSDANQPHFPPIITHHGRRDYRPEVGHHLTVRLPGEDCQSIIVRVLTEDSVLAELQGVMMQKAHSYQKGDVVGCRREVAPMIGNEIWVVQSQRSMDAAAEAEYFARAELRRIEEEKEAALRYAAEAKLPPRAPPPVEPAAKRAVLGPRRSKVSA